MITLPSLLKSAGTVFNLSLPNLFISHFKLVKSDFAATLDVWKPVAPFKSAVVVYWIDLI